MDDLMTIAYQKWQNALDDGDLEQAQKYYRALKGSEQEPPEVSFMMGLWQRQNGLYNQALDAFKWALEVNGQFEAQILYELANTYVEMKQEAEAVSYYERSLALEPEAAEVRFAYGQILGRLGQKNAAKAQLCQVLMMLDGRDVETYINVAVELSELGMGDLAIDIYYQALLMEPDNYFLYSNLGVEFAELGDFESALFCHGQGLALNDFSADLWYNLACTYSLMNAVEQGLAALEKAIILDADNKFYAENDLELSNLRQDGRFYRLLKI